MRLCQNHVNGLTHCSLGMPFGLEKLLSSLVHIMACHLFRAKPLPTPTDLSFTAPTGTNIGEILIKIKHFDLSDATLKDMHKCTRIDDITTTKQSTTKPCAYLEVGSSNPAGFMIIYWFLCQFICVSMCQSPCPATPDQSVHPSCEFEKQPLFMDFGQQKHPFFPKSLIWNYKIQWNLSVMTTSMIKFFTCDLFSSMF